ncbi:hypothetical protein NDU88_005283 [Pleurodeles waltl]|uniref:Uncharacterized protein n=1 Tax=Pleurodeles waltl TaxID=8319 RepID=A0AAV7VN36_PLEWA|nr:hypothetical protein NDU88_005283 [Pleurodeles waltl]
MCLHGASEAAEVLPPRRSVRILEFPCVPGRLPLGVRSVPACINKEKSMFQSSFLRPGEPQDKTEADVSSLSSSLVNEVAEQMMIIHSA